MIRLPASVSFARFPSFGVPRLQRIKMWMRAHEQDQRLEYEAFDAVLTLWLIGWVGLVPSVILQLWWLLPLCLLAVKAPSFYVNWRISAHAKGKLRCDWLDAALGR